MKKIRIIYTAIFTFIRLSYLKIKSQKELHRFHQKKILKLIKFVRLHSPYYQRMFLGKKDVSLISFPIIDKQIMMTHFNSINTVGVDRDQCINLAITNEKSRNFDSQLNGITVGLSSGTSGNRGLFIANDQERAIFMVSMIVKTLATSVFHPHRIGYFLRSDSKLYKTDNKNKKLQFQFFDPIVSLESHIQALNNFNPTELYAPPSILKTLSSFARSGELTISPLKIISIAEVLDPLDEKIIKENFKISILHQIYQCTEGFLGQTCAMGTIHLNEDLVYIEKEWLDDEKTKFSPIITDLYRKSQPHVRYRLNDVLTLKKQGCRCGSPFTAIEQIEGRCDDIFYFNPSNALSCDKKIRVFSDFIRRSILFASTDILEYQIIQQSFDHCHLHLKSKSDPQKVIKLIDDEMSKLALTLGFIKPRLTFDEHFEKLGLKKLRRVVRDFPYKEA